MLTAINTKETREVDVDGTIFIIGVMKNSDRALMTNFIKFSEEEVEGKMVKTMSMKGEYSSKLFISGVKEIRNININGKPSNIVGKDINIDTYNMIPYSAAEKVISEIVNSNQLTEPEVKN